MPRKPKTQNVELAAIVQQSASISPQDIELVSSVEDVEIMSMAQLQKEKQELAQKREQTLIKLDKARIQQAEKIIKAMDFALDQMMGYYDESGNLVGIPAMDFRLLTDGYKNLINSYNLVTRLDSVDTGGKAGRLTLKIEYEV